MSEKKPSRVSRFLEMIHRNDADKKSDNYEEANLARMGISVVDDRKLKARMDEYKLLMSLMRERIAVDRLDEYTDEIMDQLWLWHDGILRIGGVWATAGSDKDFAKIMRGWDKLFSNSISKCKRVRDWWATDRKDAPVGKMSDMSINSINVRNLERGLWHHVFPHAFNVLNYCFKREHVGGPIVTVVQSMNPSYGGGSNLGEIGNLFSKKQQSE